MMISTWILAAFLVFATPGEGVGGSNAAVRNIDPVKTAMAWMDALRRRDAQELNSLSVLPLAIRGFDLDSGPAAIACGGTARNDGLEGVRDFKSTNPITLEITTREGFDKAAACLFGDNLLVNYIPEPQAGQWPSRNKRLSYEAVGTIKRVAAKEVSRRLRRYKKEIGALAKNHALVQAVMTDNNGVANVVVLAVTSEGALPYKVAAVFIDELFEE